jgi:saccharopine dehydrogenase (NAD+, L-lysine forming)
MFAHCYKGQGGWEGVLSRWRDGNGTLLDLEFLQDASGRRVAAFGYHAGFAGSALALKALAAQLEKGDASALPPVQNYTDGKGYYENEDELIPQLKADLQTVKEKLGREPQVLVIGALGRCGSGATDLFRKAGLSEDKILKWDLDETKKGGPFEEIVESDIVSIPEKHE